uniref:Zinc finger and BTB domain containing 48 n=1 Tax=Haplochromis burtoni TaxID=8153 RepID=A0A3Q2V489_HAPBU
MSAAESNHAQRVLSALNQQRAVGRFCDASLNVGDGVVFLAHRNILACFTELLQQSNVPSATEFCLQGCPSDGLELLLNFVYTGELKLDPRNLDRVQQAAASLCVPEALTRCQQFKETSKEPVPVKRKRGRPRKSASDITKYEPTIDTAAASFTTAATTTATTTRSGRVVKSSRRLVTIDESPTTENELAPPLPVEKEVGDAVVEENQNSDQLAGETEVEYNNISMKKYFNDGAFVRIIMSVFLKRNIDVFITPVLQVTELQINDNVISQVSGEVEAEDDNDDVDIPEEIPEDTDEEYVPATKPASSTTSPSTATGQKCKAQSQKNKNKNGQTMEDDSKKASVQCPICFKAFKSKYYLKVHNRRHTGEKPFGCLKCGRRYYRKENLLIHEMRDCSSTYTCLICSTTFNTKEALRLHTVTHTGEMPHKCSTCPEQFMYKKNLTVHMMKVHGYPKPHAVSTYSQQHLQYCSQCPKTFLTRAELRVHEAAKHRGEKPFVCEECGHRASSRNGLQMHIKAIHRNERPFVCNSCGHAFSQKNNLNILDKHHRTHTGERPFGCDVCEQRFTEKGALLRHKASKHEEGRPHCCHICGKTFKAFPHLHHVSLHNSHIFTFPLQAHLRRHIQIHKRTENYNPRQRKLRNVIVQDVDGSPVETEAPKSEEASLICDGSTQESTNRGAESSTGLTSVICQQNIIIHVILYSCGLPFRVNLTQKV